MAHELTIRENGMAEMAFIGSRNAVWHSLGQELQDNASIEEWRVQAGMDWGVLESPVEYITTEGKKTFPDRKVLLRSDSKSGLSIVGQDFKVVQPGEVLEFFRDLVSVHGMKLSTAGTLFGGKRFWALAETGKLAEVVGGDVVKGFLLLTTAVDGTLATTAKFVAERVVCNNTLTVALGEASKSLVKKTHKVDFDPAAVKIDLGIIDKGWESFIGNMRKLADTKVSTIDATDFFQKLLFKPGVDADKQGWGATRKVTQLLNLFQNGSGAEYSKGTAWGLLNAITEEYTHGSGKRDPSHQFWESYHGSGDNFKTSAMNKVLEFVQ